MVLPTLSSDTPRISIVVPVHNEAENIAPLIDEITATLDGNASFEIIYVNDGSTDQTAAKLKELLKTTSPLRVLRHKMCCGQSAAVATGVEAARAAAIVTLDGDGQNDPEDIPRLLNAFDELEDARKDLTLIVGHRVTRRDTLIKRISSRIANGIRSFLLGDDTPDTGCGLKIFSRAAFLRFPRFDHMHRFLPALMIRQGGQVISVPVNHRPRQRGVSNYGVFDRLWVGISDLGGVMWLNRRASSPAVEEVTLEDTK